MSTETDARVYKAMTALGIKGTHQAYPEGGAPKPPFFVYDLDSGGEDFADDSSWARLPRYRVQLLEKQADAALEAEALSALEAEFGPVKTYEDWSQSEHCRILNYYFQAI